MDRNILKEKIRSFLGEDIGRGDITSESIFSPDETGKAHLVARESMIAAGVDSVAAEVFRQQNSDIITSEAVDDGVPIVAGTCMLKLEGPVLDMLKAERVALNLLQRMCGIATMTGRYVEKVKDYDVAITDTRKTTPGLRLFEKYAVLVGGGSNHRYNLTDGVLIKDNHIAACGSIEEAVARVRARAPHTIRVEVETDTLEQVEVCLRCEVDIIMLDNMDNATMKKAVEMINGRALVEASGGVNLDRLEGMARTGVDIISVGALTHSARACDIGMDWLG